MWPGWRQLCIEQVKCHGDHFDAWSLPVSKKYIESSLSEVTFQFDLRQSALKPQKHNTAERLLPFVTTYHPAVKKLKQIVMENWSFIENQPLLKTIFKTTPIISYKRGKSLKDMLVRGEL